MTRERSKSAHGSASHSGTRPDAQGGATSIAAAVDELRQLLARLRKAKATFNQYLADLTCLLYLKRARDTREQDGLPAGYRFEDLVAAEGADLLTRYRAFRAHLTAHGSPTTQAIFVDTVSCLRTPRDVREMLRALERLDWYEAREGGLREFYGEVLEANAQETTPGLGAYFTPPALVERIVALLRPQPGELLVDPAAYVGAFLVAADASIKEQTDGNFKLSEPQQMFQRRHAFVGLEGVPELRRLALMNAMLHDIEGDVLLGDVLGPSGADLPTADLIISNPPFGGGECRRVDITHPCNNKQLVALQHAYRKLKPGGRSAMVLPDNVLFEEGVGQRIRADLMDKCDLHTILRLPTGIFNASGVKTNVLFFTRGATDKGTTKATWFFDMRTNAPSFGKRTPLTRGHFAEFEKAFGDDPRGKSKRKDEGETGKFRKFTREDVAKRGDNLDITWLKDDSVTDHADLPGPEVMLEQIASQLRAAFLEVQAMGRELGVSVAPIEHVTEPFSTGESPDTEA